MAKQNQKHTSSGDNVSGDKVNYGITYADARNIAMDVFEANVLRLSQEAKNVAIERAELLTNNFLNQLFKSKIDYTTKLSNPAFQSALYESQKSFALSGDHDLEKILVDLLIERISHEERTFCQIVLDSSLDILPKLTTDQLDCLTITYLLSNKRVFISKEDLVTFLKTKLLPFSTSVLCDEYRFRHLYFVGCCAMGGGNFEPQKLEISLAKVLNLTFLTTDKLSVEEFIKNILLETDSRFQNLFIVWENSRLQNLKLTSAGMAIAIAHFNQVTGEKIKLVECI